MRLSSLMLLSLGGGAWANKRAHRKPHDTSPAETIQALPAIAAGNPLPFPFGTEVGDVSTGPNDDQSSPEIVLPGPMLFFGEEVTSAFQNTNGDVTFDAPFGAYEPELVPSEDLPPMIAVYWTDIDTGNGGSDINKLFIGASTRTQTQNVSDAEIASDLVAGTGRRGFAPSSVVVATWQEVERYSQRTDARNTFQLAIAYDDVETWALLSYEKLEFFSADTADKSVVGFNDRQGLIGQLINSITSIDEMQLFLTETNCGVPGTFAYKISDTFRGTGCGLTTQDPTLATNYGSQVGGTVIQVNNLPVCLDDNTTEVYCRFEGDAIGDIVGEGHRANREVVECISPFVGLGIQTVAKVSYATRVPLDDPPFNSSTANWIEVLPFQYSDSFVGVLPAGDDGQPLTVTNAIITVGTDFPVLWSAEGLLQTALQNIAATSGDSDEIPPIDFFIEVRAWNETKFVPTSVERPALGNSTNQTSIALSEDEFANLPQIEVGRAVVQLRIVARTDSGRVVATRSSDLLGARSISSDRRALQNLCDIELAAADLLYDCDEVLSEEPELGCPPTAGQAQTDSRFADDAACTFPNGATGDCGVSVEVVLERFTFPLDVGYDTSACGCKAFHDGASGCFRGPGGGGSGTQCCYSGQTPQGALITDPNQGAGTVDCVAGDGTLSNSIGHYITDVEPYVVCCVFGSDEDCQKYFEERPPTGSENYTPERPPCRVFGDPHIRTTDGVDYDFNGAGEYVGFCGVLSDANVTFDELVNDCEPSGSRLVGTRTTVSLHLRFAPLVPSDAGTVTVGIGIEDPLHRNGEFAITIVPHPTRRVDVFDGRDLLSFPPAAEGQQATTVLLESGARIKRSAGRMWHGITSAFWSWTNDDSSNTGRIVFLNTEERSAVIEYIRRTGQAPTIHSNLVFQKRRNDSKDSSFIRYIDLDDDNRIKTWRMNSGYEDDLEINYDANSGDGTAITCRDNSGTCSPLVDGSRRVVLIELQFNPRDGSAHHNLWGRNKFTMVGTHYFVELPDIVVPARGITDEISFEVTMPSGLIVNLGEIGGVMLPSIVAPSRLGQTVGLLGFTDGDPSNDLTDSSGNVVTFDSNATLAEKNQAIFDSFGQTWRINAEQSSLFQALSGSTQAFENFDDISYRPEFAPPTLSPDLQAQADEACGGIESEAIRFGCLFDIAATGNVELYGAVAASALQEEVTRVTVLTNNIPVFDQSTLDQTLGGPITVAPGTSLEFLLLASDPDGDNVTFALERNDGGLFSLQNQDQGANTRRLSSTSALSFVGSDDVGRFVAFVAASDGIGSSLFGVTVEVNPTNPPTPNPTNPPTPNPTNPPTPNPSNQATKSSKSAKSPKSSKSPTDRTAPKSPKSPTAPKSPKSPTAPKSPKSPTAPKSPKAVKAN